MKLTKLAVVLMLGILLASGVACGEDTEPTIPAPTPTATCTEPTIPTPTATSTASATPTSTASATATCTIMVNEWVYFLHETGYEVGCANPAACYCHELGYDMRVEEGPLGQRGICIFPDGTECGEWDFIKGQCSQEWSFCEQQGGEIIILNSSTKYPCHLISPCPYCILSCEE